MSRFRIRRGAAALLAVGALLAAPSTARAQLADSKALTAAAVKNILAAAEAKAKENQWNVSIAVSDPAGDLLGFIKLDGAATGTVQVAMAGIAAIKP